MTKRADNIIASNLHEILSQSDWTDAVRYAGLDPTTLDKETTKLCKSVFDYGCEVGRHEVENGTQS